MASEAAVSGDVATGEVVGYARVSTSEQNLDRQIQQLQAAGCGRIFEEVKSRAITDRPVLGETLRFLRPGDTLVVVALDRLGGDVRHLIDVVTDLKERDVEFVSLRETIDTRSPIGWFFFHLIASMAQLERERIRERTMEGLAAAARRGRRGGAKPKLSTTALTSAQALVERAQALKDAGATDFQTMEEIASAFGVSRTTLYRALKRRQSSVTGAVRLDLEKAEGLRESEHG